MNRKLIIIGVVVLLAVAIAWRLASVKKKKEESNKPALSANVQIPVTAIVAGMQKVDEKLVKTGTLVPFKEADITALTSGKLVDVTFDLGTRVAAGQVVAQVDNRGQQLQLEAAQLQKAKSEKDYKRYKTLLEGEATTEVALQDAKLTYDNSANQIEQLQKQISDSRIKAPVNGQVVSKLKERGEFVNPGTVLGHVVDVSRLKVNVMVAEQDAYTLPLGQVVKVTSDIYPGVTFEGKITFVSAQGDATHNYQVELQLINPHEHPLKAGTFVSVDFSRESTRQMMTVPRSSLVASLQNPYVYVVQGGKAAVKKITVGRELGDNIEVLDGLNVGDTVVTAGQVNVKEAIPIKAIIQKQ
ncbi:MAG: efflux RND transporter periplasmic adaptor subunit [Edaphocola sp.]